MRKLIVILLWTVFVVAGLALHDTVASGQTKETLVPKPSRWHGVIVMIDKDKSTMDVRRGTFTKTVHFDSSTKWTEDKGAKVIDMKEFKEGSEVVCLGTYVKGGGVMNATAIDLRR